MKTFQEKLNRFMEILERDQIEQLRKDKLDCEANIFRARVTSKPGNKYTRILVGTSNNYMIVNETGQIFGTKAAGVIHRGHYYGTLDTVENYYWGRYYAIKITPDNYHKRQCSACEDGHDPAFSFKIKLFGSVNSTNYIDITNEQYQAIKKIIGGGV
jgi:hypothetical protein